MKIESTQIRIKDSIQHYPPVIIGDSIIMSDTIYNIGGENLILEDIQPSCPAIQVLTKDVTMIPPESNAVLRFVFHTDKNTGYVQHSIRLWGNIAPYGFAEIKFDTHVIPLSSDGKDYEEIYNRSCEKNHSGTKSQTLTKSKDDEE